jgi:hypothetical protein
VARCSATKHDGSPCERIVAASREFCFAHDPARAEQRSRAASKAGRSKPSKDLAQVKHQLQSLAEDTLAGRITEKRAAVVSQVLNVLLRALEQERKIRELEEIEVRLEELERAEASEAGRRHWG